MNVPASAINLRRIPAYRQAGANRFGRSGRPTGHVATNKMRCNICGIIGFNYNDEGQVKKLNALLTHRGPDQSGFYCDESISLAHRRLSILDLSEKGIQPMSNEDGSIIIVFNGEIFNYQELKKELLDKGHKFRSNTDTEVLVHLYEESGAGSIERLNGQFAFCIYDKKKQKLLLARDRAGILPLYYYSADGQFMFSSELKCILRSGVRKEINQDALALYFRFGYISSPHCILKNACKLEPGYYLVFDLRKKSVEECRPYWRVEFRQDYTDAPETAGLIREELEKSVRSRLIADVPVGAFLSGGIDSSVVVGLIRKYKENLKTFSVKFDHAEFDESHYAREVADFFKTEHHEIAFSAQDVRKLIPELAEHYDEPFGDSSAIPTYLVSQVARRHVTVCLSGDGGDELLGGYNNYRHFMVLRVLNNLPRVFKSILRLFLNCVIKIRPKFELERVRELLRFKRMDDLELFEKLCEKIDRLDLETLLKRKVDFYDTTSGIGTKKGLSCLQHYDIARYLEGDILVKVDRAAMANSLEPRPPFLDHNFMSLCFRVNDSLKIKGKSGKWILKYAFRNLLPPATLRRKKKGFAVPVKYYLKNELAGLVEKYVFNYSGHDFFDRDFLKGMVKPGKLRDTTRLYWNVIMFNLWHEKWMAADE